MLPKSMRKMSREERAAELLRREDLTLRLEERIEQLRRRAQAADRSESS